MISTLHTNELGTVVQAQANASGARVSDNHGHHLDVRYDEVAGTFVIEAQSSNVRVETGSNKIWVTYK
jgi:hypothetical protein